MKKILKDPIVYARDASVSELVKLLRKLSKAYYEGEALVDDEIYDEIYDILKEKDPENPFLSEVGAPVEHDKVTLPYPMGTLAKIRPGKESLDSFINKYPGPYVLSDKLDGISAQFYKDKNGNVGLYTRGDFHIGKNISNWIPYLIPKKVIHQIPNDTSIRGEIVISIEDFEQIVDSYKNARNAVSGIVMAKRIDSQIAKLCQFVAHSMLHPRVNQLDQYSLLNKYGFKVVEYKTVDEIDFEMLEEYLIEREKKGEFRMDGIVVIDFGKVYKKLTERPDFAFAFKIQKSDYETTVVQVLWSVSRDKYIKPRIEIEPVELPDVTITYLTAFNAKYVVDNGLGPGAIVRVTRSGDVIPYITRVVKKVEPQMPDIDYEWNETNVDIISLDENDDDSVVKQIASFFSVLGVKNLGEGIVRKLVDNGYKSIESILSAEPSELAEIEGLGEKSVNKIFKNIDKAIENLTLETLMVASHKFGRGFGEKKIREILEAHPDILNSKWNNDTITSKILELPGFNKSAYQFTENLPKFRNFFNSLNKVIDLSHLLKPKKEKKMEKETDCSGLKIVFTGFRDKDLEKKIISCGGKVTTSVSKNTSVVVCADDCPESSKTETAKQLGIKILPKSKFIATIGKFSS